MYAATEIKQQTKQNNTDTQCIVQSSTSLISHYAFSPCLRLSEQIDSFHEYPSKCLHGEAKEGYGQMDPTRDFPMTVFKTN